MITGREPNIIRCMEPEIAAKQEAARLAAEARHAAEVEKLEQQIFLKYLKGRRAEAKLWFINPLGHKPSTIEPGHPDFTIWVKGKCFCIEMKAAGGKLSKEQENAISCLQGLDHEVHIAWNAGQATRIVEFYLSVLTTSKNDKPK